MPTKKESGERQSTVLRLRARMPSAGKTEPLLAYVFDRNGQLLASAPLPEGEERSGDLKLPQELQGAALRVVLGPPLSDPTEGLPRWMAALVKRSGEGGTSTLAALRRRGALERGVMLGPDLGAIDLGTLPDDIVRWLLCTCTVRGRVVKRLTLPDGSVKELGVCHACVAIYEVDAFPRLIMRLPELDLFRLRDDLWQLIKKYYPKLKVWPPPPPDGEVYLKPEITVPPLVSPMMASFSETASSAASETEEEIEPLVFQAQTQAQLEPIFVATSGPLLRKAFIDAETVLIPWLCLLKSLHFHYHTDLIKWVCTDEQGRFETTIKYLCAGDKPDLYFKVLQCIGGTLHILYNPGVACHTYWNYACGTEVVLEVTDPAAITCAPSDPVDPPPGVPVWIMPYGVGGLRLDQIKSSGLTDYGGGGVDAPFGSVLGLRLGYSGVIPTGTLRYYRWLYQKVGDPEWSELAAPVGLTVVRHYVDEDLSLPDEPPTFPAYTLGPKAIGGKHLYEFKPHTPPPLAGHSTYWPPDDWFADIYSGILDSPALPGEAAASGLYRFKLEIYDAAGNQVMPGPAFRFIVPDGLRPDGVTINSRLALPAEIDGGGFVFFLYIDNRKCQATIDSPSIGAVTAGDLCGFLRYHAGDNVHIAFHAVHPANFARFSFAITRGSTGVSRTVDYSHGVPPPEVSALVVPDVIVWPPVSAYTGDGSGNFARNFTTGGLLGPCAEAAFAETLYVYAKATNGWSRLYQYDASAVRAFALAPMP